MALKKLKVEIAGERSIEIISFMDKCFKWKEDDRASAEELFNHPFIRR